MDGSIEFSLATLALAAAAGFLSFVSPCVLPLLPAYLSYMGGVTVSGVTDSRWRVLRGSLLFVAGLATTFTLFGATASFIGQFLLAYQPVVLQIAGVIIIFFGLSMLGLFDIPFLNRTVRVGPTAGKGGAFLMGAAFGIGWTPCIGPFLTAVLAMASQESTVWSGAALLALYALGLGVPFIIAGLLFDRISPMLRRMGPTLGIANKVGGAVLVVMGFLVFSGQLLWLSGILTRVFGVGLTL